MNLEARAHKACSVSEWDGEERTTEIVYVADDSRTRVYLPIDALPRGQRTLKTAPGEVTLRVEVGE